MYLQRLGAYPTDVIMCTAWCLLDTGSVETWCFRAQASRRSLFALATEIVAVMFLGTRICVRYGVLYGLFPLILYVLACAAVVPCGHSRMLLLVFLAFFAVRAFVTENRFGFVAGVLLRCLQHPVHYLLLALPSSCPCSCSRS